MHYLNLIRVTVLYLTTLYGVEKYVSVDLILFRWD